ncbi:MAG: DUF4965 domain-containing protein [Tyzzerella sp.]|nr:DUF4965 domain-containing protein [Tyzzerella sp.]
MKINRAASVPLVVHDPFFSVWSNTEHLYDDTPVHWSGADLFMKGWLTVDGKKYAFLGKRRRMQPLQQLAINVTATATEYVFECDEVGFQCRFTSPLLLNDMLLVSRPCTYVDFELDKRNAKDVSLEFIIHADLVRKGKDDVIGFNGVRDNFNYSYMGRAIQQPLSGSDDGVKIDWGYAYVATQDEQMKIRFNKEEECLYLQTRLEDKKQTGFIIAYDDLLSINYFGQWRKAYWTNTYATILDAIGAAFADKEETLKKADQLDKEIEDKAYEIGGEAYAYLCNMSYRQTIAAHKLITDENGDILFLSKENDSNGCIGTVDVSYPSIPLFMLYDTEYVKGMLRPIFKFATCDIWEFDFAPHDVGRYPYAWGQAYAYKENFGENATEVRIWKPQKSGVFPPFYMYPAGSNVYDLKYQMPVEECGNMLIMAAAVCKADGNADFAKPYWDILKLWKNYLVKYGSDPGDQLCTDDFAGHLEHNVNLSVKAIIGIEAYAMLAEMLGETEEAEKHHILAKEMAADWEVRANAGDHYSLAFGSPDTWSLKYNLVWDKMWGSGLFSKEVYEKELAYYIEKTLEYGTPLDSRENLAKSDWILWCAAMANNKEQTEKLIKPVAKYLEESTTRVPFSDWYMADTGTYCMFMARSVQGGIFMPMMFHK